jgi:hypothetical protein
MSVARCLQMARPRPVPPLSGPGPTVTRTQPESVNFTTV